MSLYYVNTRRDLAPSMAGSAKNYFNILQILADRFLELKICQRQYLHDNIVEIFNTIYDIQNAII